MNKKLQITTGFVLIVLGIAAILAQSQSDGLAPKPPQPDNLQIRLVIACARGGEGCPNAPLAPKTVHPEHLLERMKAACPDGPESCTGSGPEMVVERIRQLRER